jgi:hypothetical protein
MSRSGAAIRSPASGVSEGGEALPFRLRAFGIAFRSHWRLPGSQAAAEPQTGSEDSRIVALRGEIERLAWHQPAERVFAPGYPDGRLHFIVDRNAGGYRLWFDGYGRYLVSGDGLTVGCLASTASPSRRERFLFAQALPLASVLRGHEVLHASAVAGDRGVAAFTGRSGAGKSSLCSRLVARGARFFTDDVLALERQDQRLVAHPGPAFLALPPGDAELLRHGARRLGSEVGASDKLHVSPRPAADPLPLLALYSIEPAAQFAIEELAVVDPRDLLARFHAPFVTTARRLHHQLDVSAQMASSVRRFRLQIPRQGFPERVLAQIESHLRGLAL